MDLLSTDPSCCAVVDSAPLRANLLSALTRDYDADFDAAGERLDAAAKDSRYLNAMAFFHRAVRNPRVSTNAIMEVLGEKQLRVLRYDDARFLYLKEELLRLRERR